MPLFFLHIRDRENLLEDDDGQEFSTLAQAREVAILSAREIMSERIMAGMEPDHSQIEIADASGQILLVVPFLEAVSAH